MATDGVAYDHTNFYEDAFKEVRKYFKETGMSRRNPWGVYEQRRLFMLYLRLRSTVLFE